MSGPTVFTRTAGISVYEDEEQRIDGDWDRRLIVLEGEYASKTAAADAWSNRPFGAGPGNAAGPVWWPEKVGAKAVKGAKFRVTIECAGLADGEEKWYQLTEDNGELLAYQLQNITISDPTHGWPTATYDRVNVEMGTPKYGWLGFTKTRPRPELNGQPVATPIRGVFPTVPPPPWRASGVNVTANFPGGWRQTAVPYKVLGGYNATGAALLTPAWYKGQWFYEHREKLTLG